ncbi:RNA-binding protein like [Arabidopsis thaliana]|uniref:RNA-binding protein like n=2 Tax=Arabidopsis thaliana TaxID=3702 RepID=Q9SVM7_ARATH|nr:RNA-binding protein like [Arabidopsis thaliana]CAB78428.1 RNA-binding protein like [Arabidopsis thaliana]
MAPFSIPPKLLILCLLKPNFDIHLSLFKISLKHGYQGLRRNFVTIASDLSPTTTDDMLREAFSGYGNVVDAIVMRDRYTDRSRGFGFVTYSSHSEAEAAVSGMDGKELNGRRVSVKLFGIGDIDDE